MQFALVDYVLWKVEFTERAGGHIIQKSMLSFGYEVTTYLIK